MDKLAQASGLREMIAQLALDGSRGEIRALAEKAGLGRAPSRNEAARRARWRRGEHQLSDPIHRQKRREDLAGPRGLDLRAAAAHLALKRVVDPLVERLAEDFSGTTGLDVRGLAAAVLTDAPSAPALRARVVRLFDLTIEAARAMRPAAAPLAPLILSRPIDIPEAEITGPLEPPVQIDVPEAEPAIGPLKLPAPIAVEIAGAPLKPLSEPRRMLGDFDRDASIDRDDLAAEWWFERTDCYA